MSQAFAYKLAVFDVDGTLTEHHTPPTPEARAFLTELQKSCRLLFLSAGSCRRIIAQMQGINAEILGNYGMEYAKPLPDGSYEIETLHKVPFDRADVLARAERLRREFSLTNIHGESLIIRENGCVVMPLLGTDAPLELRLSFDPDHKKRLVLFERVVAAFPERHVFIGGTSCFDLPPKPHTKLFALEHYCRAQGFKTEDVAVFGDDYTTHGNDEPLFRSPFHFTPVDHYTNLPQLASFLLPITSNK